MFRASRYGWAASDFHRHCNDRGPTVVLIRTADGWVIGGYAASSWNSSKALPKSKQRIVSVRPQEFDRLSERQKYPFKPSSKEMVQSELYGHSSWGPSFGFELCISNYGYYQVKEIFHLKIDENFPLVDELAVLFVGW